LLPIGSLHNLESIREVSFDGLDRELAYQQSTLKYDLAANQQFPYNQ